MGEKGAAFLHLSFGVETSAAFLHLSVCGQNRGVKGAAAFLHLSVCGQNKGVKVARPSFTSRFVAKTEG